MTQDGAVQAAEVSRALVAALGEVSAKARGVSAKMELFGDGSMKAIDEICLDLRAASGIAQSIRHTFDTGIAGGISDGLLLTAESQNLTDVQEFRAFLSLIDHWSGEAEFLHKGIEGSFAAGRWFERRFPRMILCGCRRRDSRSDSSHSPRDACLRCTGTGT
ncbi:MAG TPA: hypothetical protein VGD53_17530 [Actinoallomurus sp.]|jgi:hypothetical protein